MNWRLAIGDFRLASPKTLAIGNSHPAPYGARLANRKSKIENRKWLTAILVALLGAAPLTAQDWGTIKGRITWGGQEIPKRNPVNVKPGQDQNHCLAKGAILEERWVINEKNKGLRWTFVWLAPAEEKGKLPIHPDLQKPPAKPVVIDQPLCMFVPHAAGIRQGQELLVLNPAPVAHNFKYGGHPDRNPGANPIMPANSKFSIKNLKADRIPVEMQCGMHPWMKGWIRVFDHPYFAVTDENGNFEIKDAPAGNFRMFIWHESGWRGGVNGRNGQPITIKNGANDLGNIIFPPPADLK